MNVFSGPRPDLTPAQVAATLVAGVPVIATLLSVFGLADLNPREQQALSDALTWCGILAGLLIGGDVGLRTARNLAESRANAAALGAAAVAPASVPAFDAETDALDHRLTVTDDEEFGLEEEYAALESRVTADDPDRLERTP
jgi:hypothetical protein